MASVWYVGRATERKLTPSDWAAAGVTGDIVGESVWNKTNGWSIPEANFSTAQLNILRQVTAEFKTGQVDGPRSGTGSNIDTGGGTGGGTGGTGGGTGGTTAVSDASPSVKGVIKLAGDLGGTADVPTVKAVKTINGNPPDTAGNINVAGGGTVADASTTTKGQIQLAGDLTGTADAPLIGNKAVSLTKLAQSVQDSLNGADSVRARFDSTTGVLASAYLPTAAFVTYQTVANAAARLELTAVQVQPGDKVRQTDTTHVYELIQADPSIDANWIDLSAGSGGSSPNATNAAPGLIQLTGDLGGTATAPTVPSKVSKYNPPVITTVAYNAAAMDYVLADASTADVPVQLPTNPPHGTPIAVRFHSTTAGKLVTVNCGPGDILNRVNGLVTKTLRRPGETVEFKYDAAAKVWMAQTNLEFADLQTLFDSKYASISSTSGVILDSTGDDLKLNQPIFLNGIEGPNVDTVIGQLKVELEIPSELGITSTTLRLYEGTATTRTQLGQDVVITAGQIDAVVPGVTNWTWKAGNRIYATPEVVTGGTSTSFIGSGFKLRAAIGSGTVLPARSVPAVPTLSATGANGKITLGLALPAGSQSGTLFRDNLPYKELAGLTTWDDPGLPVGESHTYRLASRGLGVLSVASAAVTASATAGVTAYSLFKGTDGSGTQNQATILGGTANGQSVTTATGLTIGTTTIASLKHTRYNSGNATGGVATDKVGSQFNGVATLHTLWDFKALIAFLGSNAIFQIYLATNDQSTGPFTLTNGIQFEATTGDIRTGFKAVDYPSTGTNTFTTIAAKTTYSTIAGATVPNADGLHFQPWRFRIYDSGSGVIKTEVWQGPAVADPTLGMPASPNWSLIQTATLDATQKSKLLPGRFAIVQQGKQGTAGAAETETTIFVDGSVSPLSAAGS